MSPAEVATIALIWLVPGILLAELSAAVSRSKGYRFDHGYWVMLLSWPLWLVVYVRAAYMGLTGRDIDGNKRDEDL